MFDWGLLALRSAGFLLAFTFGLQKDRMVHFRLPIRQTVLIDWPGAVDREGRFPSSSYSLALWITFNESIGALFIGCGLFTRVLAASAALGMAGALYTSVRLSEDWLRAALYLIVFIGLSLTGPGKLSV